MYRGLESLIKPLHPWNLPRNVDIEITNLCQLRCEMCPRQSFKNERKIGQMDKEEFSHILNELKEVPWLSFSGNGEATLHPEFMEFFHMAQDDKKKLTISTNGLGLVRFRDENLKEMIKGFCMIDISMDSPYKGKYESIRKGASFEDLLEGIKRLVKIKPMGKAIISIHMVYVDQKIKEIEDMIRLIKELGLNRITIGKLMACQGTELKEKRSIDIKDMGGLRKFSKDNGVEIVFNFYQNFSLTKKLAGCNWPWRYAFISYEGIVTPCCSVKDPARINLGNIFEEDFKSIWYGERFTAFRKNIKKGFFPSICRETNCWFMDKK